MTVSNAEKKAPDGNVHEEEMPYDQSESVPQPLTFEELRAAGVGILSDEEVDDLIACVHEWRHEWIHKSEV
jgi:hypothetical protein